MGFSTADMIRTVVEVMLVSYINFLGSYPKRQSIIRKVKPIFEITNSMKQKSIRILASLSLKTVSSQIPFGVVIFFCGRMIKIIMQHEKKDCAL
jgi:hypothetical protein